MNTIKFYPTQNNDIEMLTFTIDRYSISNCSLNIFPRNKKIEANDFILNEVLINNEKKVQSVVQLGTYIKENEEWIRLDTREIQIVNIEISCENVHSVVNCLFDKNLITVSERQGLQEYIFELDNCLSFENKLNDNISLSQKELIEYFVHDSVELLRNKLNPYLLVKSLQKAVFTLRNKEESLFHFIIKTSAMVYNSNGYEKKIITSNMSEETKRDIIDALFLVGKVLTGRANLESALLQSGENLPNLTIQREVVMNLVIKDLPIELLPKFELTDFDSSLNLW